MLGVGRLTPPPLPPLCLITPTTFYKHLSCISPPLQYHHHILLKRSGFCLYAQKKQQNSSLSRLKLEKLDFDDDDDDDDEDEYEDDEFDEELDDETDDGDELMLPFDKMDDWHMKKPKGFGEGKVYDTSIEDKLLIELEKIREAQLANVEKLKTESKVPEPKSELKEFKASEVAPGCVRIRISNLPKKRNIHRDLKSAFKGVNGITNILPVASGTKKTRDPVCKGFSFVDFKSLEDADRFVKLFSGQNIAFGKTEKRIKCEILKPRDANEGLVHDGHSRISKSSSTNRDKDGVQVDDIGEHDPQLDSWEDDDFDELDEDFEDEEIVGDIRLLNRVEKSDIDSLEARLLKQSSDALPTKPKEKSVQKKKPVLIKPDNTTKVKVPGSAKRLVDFKLDHFGLNKVQREDDDFDKFDEDSEDEEIVGDIRLLSRVEKSDIDSLEARLLKQSSDAMPTKPKEKSVRKKKPVLKKPDNTSKIKVPGSAKRLKVSEKAKLADVYSRYGVKQEALASNET